MIDAVAAQIGQAGAAPRYSPLSPAALQRPSSEPTANARTSFYQNGSLENASQSKRAPQQDSVQTAQIFQKPGTIDKQGLLSAQAGETEEERQRRKDPEGLTEEERAIVKELQARDREVRAHEQAHARVGGQYAGSPTYQFETGPDGKRYAVSGQVKIDVSPVRGDPEATIRKMEQVKKAALAPAEPSAQDRAVASKADAVKAKARAELSQERAREQREAREETAEETEETQSRGSGQAEGNAREAEPTGLEAINFNITGGALAESPDIPEDSQVTRTSSLDGRNGKDQGAFTTEAFQVAEALAAYSKGPQHSAARRGFTGAADATHVLNLVT